MIPLKVLLGLLLTVPAVHAADFNVYSLLQTMSSQPATFRSSFTDPQVCYDRLISADNDSNYQVDREEYVKYVRQSGPSGFVSATAKFEDLPLALQSTFNALSCLCPGSAKTDCCNDSLGINGAGGDANTDEANELFLICSLTRMAIDFLVGRTDMPTSPPTFTTQPTPSPTNLASSPPTSLAPTISPSRVPTMEPTMKPSASPTVTLSNPPTGMPSTAPSRTASGLPTTRPSVAPTLSPSLSPTVAPSIVPSLPPEPTVSPGPTVTPSAAPTAPLRFEYRVGVKNGTYVPELYDALLVDALDSLAPEVLVATLGERLRLRRKLQSVTLPTQIDGYLEDECDAQLPSEDGCAVIQASVLLQGTSDAAVAEDFKSRLQDSIAAGELSEKLQTANPDTPLYIIDDPLLNSLDRGGIVIDDEDGGTIAGFAIAGTVLFSACLLYYIWHDRQREDKEELEPLPNAPRELVEDEQAEPFLEEKMVPITPERKKKKPSSKSLSPSGSRGMDHDSDAGDSGWSSSAGVSSLNTGGDNQMLSDEMDFETAQGGSQMGSSLDTPSSTSGQDDVSVPTTSSVTRADLDNAIEAGDWAAVGATAALLAAASDSNSYSSRSITNPGTSTRDGTSTVSSFEAAHVAELDHLVDAGDWEGVVLAAARFEASTVASDSESRMSSSLASSKTRKQQEFRAQVEEMVKRVAPEESENIDEMILQFHGREDELIETLKIMEERKLAQEAKNSTPTAANTRVGASSRSLGTGSLTPQRKGGSVGTSLGPQVEGSAKSLGTGVLQMTPREKKQSRLEQAIEAGDWEAVGEAAAQLNDASSASSADTDEINRLADGYSAGTGDFSTESGKKRADKAEELDKLIDQGDWMGVVQAAADLETDGKKTRTKSWFSKESKEKDESRDERIKKLQAEQEALEQADIWMTIAEKSKDDGKKDDRGASEAADWAIGRSLAALVEADGSQGTSSPKKGSGADTEEYEV